MLKIQEKLQQNFDDVYTRLNEKQKEAVNAIDGPVMVIAGPGTGKTQILAARIGKILLETDTMPGNILCLTYTDAGAVAMRKRLTEFIGSAAHSVSISTFHAFCNEVIQNNLSLFEKNNLNAISDIEKIELLRELIDELPKNNPLKRYRGEVYYDLKRMKDLFADMKKEGWTPEQINDAINRYIGSLPLRDKYIYKNSGKNYKKGDVKQNKIDEESEKMEATRAAVNLFERFQQKMEAHERYDFDDMINWVISAFENNADLLLNYQEKYQYILVDEFQDTSGTQNKIIELLTNYWDVPNVFVVGDDDQSIYRFQGANVENMLSFYRRYNESIKTIVLTENYRSTQPILDTAKVLINHNQNRLINDIPGLTKDIRSANLSINNINLLPFLRSYKTSHDEMMHITLEVERLLAEGVAPGKIAVLYRQNVYGSALINYFRLKKIPYYTKRSVDLLKQPLIKKIILILEYLHQETSISYSGDEILFKIMHFDLFEIPPMEVAKLSVETASLRGDNQSMRKLLYDKVQRAKEKLFNDETHQALVKFDNYIEELIGKVENLTLQQLIQEVMYAGGFVHFVAEGKGKIEDLQLLTGFFDFIKEETSRKPDMVLPQLMNLLDVMEKEREPMPLVLVTGMESAVNLLTAHGSKGLEFEHVFLAQLNKSSWEKLKGNNKFLLPDTLYVTPLAADNLEELRRLFYVALTRAETHLYLSFIQFQDDGKSLEPTQFLTELRDEISLVEESPEIPEQERLFFDINRLIPQAPELEKAEENFVNKVLEKFVMNVTALNTYLHCPLGFYYKNILRIPSGKNENTEFGSAVHHALQKLFSSMLNSADKEFPPKEKMLDDFTWYMKKHRESFTDKAFKRRSEQGEIVLTAYYDKYVSTWDKIVSVEKSLTVNIDGILLKGKLDKLEFNGNEVNVVDYKTGKVENAKKKLEGPNDKQPDGGDYWRQAVFYKILVDNSDNAWRAVSTEFDFVEPKTGNEFVTQKINITPADIETVKQQIISVWNKIKAHDFYVGCGKKDCEWCNFAKDHNLAIHLHLLEEEQEETTD